MIRMVVFDLDGTLVDSFEDIARAANSALAALGLPALSTGEVKQHVGRGLENLLRGLLPQDLQSEVPRALTLTKAYYSEHPADFSTVYPGGLELLERLGDQGIVRGVLSNKADPLVQAIVEALNLKSGLEEAWGHRTGFPLKPEPASLLDMLNRRGIPASECLVVGDGIPDWELAGNAQTQFLPVNYGIVTAAQWEGFGLANSAGSLQDVGKWIVAESETLPAQSGRK